VHGYHPFGPFFQYSYAAAAFAQAQANGAPLVSAVDLVRVFVVSRWLRSASANTWVPRSLLAHCPPF
jgi:hypothetical protein